MKSQQSCLANAKKEYKKMILDLKKENRSIASAPRRPGTYCTHGHRYSLHVSFLKAKGIRAPADSARKSFCGRIARCCLFYKQVCNLFQGCLYCDV